MRRGAAGFSPEKPPAGKFAGMNRGPRPPGVHARRRGAGAQAGFTLVELMLVLALMALILSLAVPSMARFVAGHRLSLRTNDLVSTLHLVRGEAVRRGTPVTLRAGSGDASFHLRGWTAFVDANGDGARAADEELIQSSVPAGDTITVVRVQRSGSTWVTDTLGSKAWLSFQAVGTASRASAFRICDAADRTLAGRVVQVNATGRVSLVTTGVTCP